jgi:outer membrane protein
MGSLKRFSAWILWLVAACGVALAQDPAQPLTLDDAVRLALSRNPEVLVAQAQLDELKGKITEVRAGAFPQLELQGYGLRMRDPSILNSSSFDQMPAEFRDALVPRASNLFDAGLVLKQPLYTAGKVRTAVQLAETSQKEKIATLEAVRQQVAFKVFQAFHDILLAKENLSVIQETLKQRQQHVDQARNRFRLGVATEVDVLRSEVNVANTRPELIRAENRVRMARSALNNLIVVALDFPTQISGRLEYKAVPTPAPDELQLRAMESKAEVIAAKRQLDEARMTLSLANAEKKLSVDMEARFGLAARDPKNLYKTDFSRWNLTFNFKLPFLDGGRKVGLIAQSASRVRAAEQSLALLENSVKLAIKAALDDMQSAAQSIEAAQLSIVQAERVLTMMQANYQYGAATTLDVVDAQTAVTLARNAQINATYDFELAKARLRLASGTPILDTGEVK